jgi:N-acetylglucosamine kinase-like BadF-type ATPase
VSLRLGIDIGGSGSRVAIREHGPGGDAVGPRRELVGERVGVTAAGSSVPETALALLRRARAAWPDEFARIDAVGLGATGLATLVAEPRALAEALRAELALGGAAAPGAAPGTAAHGTTADGAGSPALPPVAVAIDAVTAHLGALGGASGAIVALGTGAIAFGSDGHEIWRRVDGWGHLLGDRGGGAWIGMQGLRAAMLAHDGVDASGGALLDAARARFGDPLAWPGQLYTRDDRAGVLAGFAPAVAALAAEGDTAAVAIMTEAGVEAARSGVAALVPGLEPRLAATGGLFSAGGALALGFAETVAALRPDAMLQPALGDPLDGALLLAGRAAEGDVSTHAPFVWTAGVASRREASN